MKIFFYIFIFISVFCNAQKIVNTSPSVMYQNGNFKITDADLHYHISGAIQTVSTSFYYWKTEKKALSTFLGISTSIFFGMIKEFAIDKQASSSDIEHDIKGSLTYGFFTFGSISDMEKRQQLDTLKFQNLNTK